MNTTRRDFLIAAGGLLAGLDLALTGREATAAPGAMEEAIRKVVGQAPVHRGRVKLDIPPLIENGNSVALSVKVESPMTPTEYVKAIHVFAEKNPLPNVFSAYLGARAGEARITTRVRLADTQVVVAVAELSDGAFWSDSASVVVTLAACFEELSPGTP